MTLPNIDSLDLQNKKVLLRADLDVPIEGSTEEIAKSQRLIVLKKTVDTIFNKGANHITIAGHLGRNNKMKGGQVLILDGKKVDSSVPSTFKIWGALRKVLEREITLVNSAIKTGTIENWDTDDERIHEITLLENLRFYDGETENSPEFAKELSKFGDVYINEAFATSHREHASIVGLPKLLPSAFGIRFIQEIENLSKVFDPAAAGPAHPIVVTLSGLKDDKLTYLDSFKQKADKVLIAGRLGEFLGEDYKDDKVEIARLVQDKEDITINSIEKFEAIIAGAKTILVSGPMGKFEEEGHRQGTERVFKKIAETDAFKVAGGGDTEHALEMFGIKGKFNWVSTGGGAMLEFLANGTLPGIEAIRANS